MLLTNLFSNAVANSVTNYFVIDSGNYEKDNDFITYAWHRHNNNKMKAGDVFIYRKPQKLSNNGQFYFYGAGQFSRLEGEDAVTGYITNQHPFKKPIFQSNLESFEWEWKKRGKNWEHYWNQYGINQITKNDFLNLLTLLNEDAYESDEDSEVVKYDAQIAEGNFYVEDEIASVKVRSWQRAWSDRIKNNYGYTCAMCDVTLPDFLVGSHIIPSSKDKKNRMNPSNGICLCILHDKAFDRGYITINDKGIIIFSPYLIHDNMLKDQLILITRKNIRRPLFYIPGDDFLQYHRSKVYKSKLN